MLKTIIILLLSIIAGVVLVVYDILPSFVLSAEESEMLKFTMICMLLTAGLCFVVSEITRNFSQTDKLWNIMPAVYAWIFAFQGDFQPRSLLMAILASVWSARITFNFWRRGGFPKNILRFWEGVEDYRWSHIMRNNIFRTKNGELSRFKWGLFNLFFISYYQHILIWGFTLPAYMVIIARPTSLLSIADILVAMSMFGFIVLEFISDQQQYNFQTNKYKKINKGEALGEYKIGFCTKGLWRVSRHPNFLTEQSIWLCFYLFSVVATGNWLNMSVLGVVLLLLLFQGSVNFSEGLSAGKYPLYSEYQKQVGKFIPKFWKDFRKPLF